MFRSPVVRNCCTLSAVVLLGACVSCRPPRPQGIEFVNGLSAEEIERQHPLSAADRAALTPENVETLTQWEVDQIYARLTAGSIPEGPWEGRFFFAEGGGPRKLSEALGGLRGKLVDIKLKKLSRLGEALWKGKVFYKEEGVLRNMINHEKLVEELFGAASSEVRKETINGRQVALLFPAKLYCGDSLYDPRRESVIIDYAETDTIEGYVPQIDGLAGRDGLDIRDEIRKVRPGFYLGRAYAGGKMLLTFTLYNHAAEQAGGASAEECWDGSGPRPVIEPAPAPEDALAVDEMGEGASAETDDEPASELP